MSEDKRGAPHKSPERRSAAHGASDASKLPTNRYRQNNGPESRTQASMAAIRTAVPRGYTDLRDQIDGRVAPSFPANVPAEQALLGSLLLRNAGLAEVRGIVVAEDFSMAAHQLIFDALAEIVAAGRPANPITMAHLLNADRDAFPDQRPTSIWRSWQLRLLRA
jgi:hypothetical protein